MYCIIFDSVNNVHTSPCNQFKRTYSGRGHEFNYSRARHKGGMYVCPNTTTATANWTTAGCHRCASWHGVIWGRPACRLTACCSFTVVNVLICSFCAQQTKAYTRETCILHSRFCYTSTPDNLHSMNSQILDQITAEESFNTRRFDAKIFIRCTKCKDAATYIPAHQL